MDRLKEVGLYGGELVPISGSLAKRYNDCLSLFGLKPTALERFHIDGMGWSPEISEEKKDPYYLNIGEANSNAVIVSPQQKDKPVHMPFHSFDRDVIIAIFAAYEKEIRDITKDSAICVQLDQKIDSYYEAFDLLRYKKLHLSFKLLNDLGEQQKQQLELVDLFMKDNNFIDRQLHQKILNSAKSYGDLRGRKLSLEPIDLKIGSFYTKAFGGIFVLRDFVNDIIVFESMEMFQKAIKDTNHEVSLFHVSHNELTATLVNYRIADFDLKKAIKTKRYVRLKKHLFVEALETKEHSIKEILDSQLLFKKYLNDLPMETRKRIMSAELYNQRKIVERELKMDDVVDVTYVKALLEPHSSLDDEQKKLVWKLLTKITPKDPLHLYWYDKESFYRTYITWPADYREWVIDCILQDNINFEL